MNRRRLTPRKKTEASKFWLIPVIVIIVALWGLTLRFPLDDSMAKFPGMDRLVNITNSEEFVEEKIPSLAQLFSEERSHSTGLLQLLAYRLQIQSRISGLERKKNLDLFLGNMKPPMTSQMLSAESSLVLMKRRILSRTEILLRSSVVAILPGEALNVSLEGNKPLEALHLRCLGATPDRQDLPAQFRISNAAGKEALYEISPKGTLSEIAFPLGFAKEQITLSWPTNAPCILAVVGAKQGGESRVSPGLILVTIDKTSGAKSALKETLETLKAKYGASNIAVQEKIWPSATTVLQNLMTVFSGKEITSPALFKYRKTAENISSQTLESVLGNSGWTTVRANMGDFNLCSDTHCDETEPVTNFLGASDFDLYFELNRKRELASAASQFLTARGLSLQNTYLNLNFILPENAMALTWNSAINSHIPLGKWLVGATIDTTLKSQLWRLQELKTEEKTSQIDRTLTSFLNSLGEQKPTVVILEQRNEDFRNSKSENRVPVWPGRLIIAGGNFESDGLENVTSTTDVLPAIKSATIPLSSGLKRTPVENSVVVNSPEEEIYIFSNTGERDSEPIWISVPTRRVPLENTSSAAIARWSISNAKLADAFGTISKIRGKRLFHTLNFYFKNSENPSDLTIFFDSPLTLWTCFGSKEANTSKLIQSEKGMRFATKVSLGPNEAWHAFCAISGKLENAQTFSLVARTNDVVIPAEKVGFGQFGISFPLDANGATTWTGSDMASRVLAETVPLFSSLPALQLFVWKDARATSSPVLQSQMRVLTSEVIPPTAPTPTLQAPAP